MKPAAAWLICYDIADPKRLVRVHRAACRFAVPVQYSVFWARLDRAGLDAALRSIAVLIDPRADDVRFYPLPENVRCYAVGRAILPEGVRLYDAGFDRFVAEDARASPDRRVHSHRKPGNLEKMEASEGGAELTTCPVREGIETSAFAASIFLAADDLPCSRRD